MTATYKQLMEALGGIEGLLRKVAAKPENEDLRREVEMNLHVLQTMAGVVQQSFVETEEQKGGGRAEAALALEEIERRPRQGMPLRSRPTFIIGCRRSGTTLLAWLLDSHPDVAAVPESSLCYALLADHEPTSRMYDRRLPLVRAQLLLEPLGEPRAQFFTRIAQVVDGVFADYAARAGKRRWVDKEAFLHESIDLLDAVFGYQAQYLYIVRHGLDAALSASERFGRRLGTPMVRQGTLSVRGYLDEWVDANEPLMDFCERNEDRCLLVRYEELVTRPEPEARRILEFLGEPWSPTLFADMQQKDHHPGLGDNKILATGGRIDPGRRERWRSWPPALLRQLGRLADPTLVRLGYPPVEVAAESPGQPAAELALPAAVPEPAGAGERLPS
jgi:protein-tyrosine sulfotransferase